MKKHIIYLCLVALLFWSFTLVFDTFPRPKVSELEKRELSTFPVFSWEKLTSGEFTKEVSSWFSDSEPFRDELMTLSMQIKDLISFNPTDDNIKFHAGDSPLEPITSESDSVNVDSDMDDEDDSLEDDDDMVLEVNAKIAHAGIIIAGKGENTRALMCYGGSANGCTAYAEAANLYKKTFGNNVNIYCMVIPTSIEFYCPPKVQNRTKSQLATTQHVFECLDSTVKAVDIYPSLKKHRKEPIYLRTDHHWAPLGAFYAAKKFAQVTGVPFMELDHYEADTVHRFVGSMYGYSKDIAVKNAPEDFVYYVPKDVEYSTTYIVYNIDNNYRVTGEHRPAPGPFFYKFKDGNGGAYSTMMGSDTKLTHVRTSTKNGRRLIILKDSFGNALPGFLFYSFEEIHVIDNRYFTKDIIAYVEEHGITDILFANNIFSAYSNNTCKHYTNFLHQQWSKPTPKPKPENKVNKDTLKTPASNTAPVHQEPDVEQHDITPPVVQTNDSL